MTETMIWQEAPAPQIASIPHSKEAEEATIGAVLINPEIYYDVAEFLNAEDFYVHRHKWIWEAFARLVAKHEPVDLLTVSEELDRVGKLAEIGGSAYLTALVSQAPTSMNAASYGRIVESHAVRRKLINAANEIAKFAYDEEKDIETVKDKSFQSLEAVTLKDSGGGLQAVGSLASAYYDRVDERSKSDDYPGVPTGFIDLDKLLANMQQSDFLIIAGRPSQGKTGFLTDIAWHNTVEAKPMNRKKVAMFEMEMSNDSILDRIVSKMTGIDTQKLRTGRLLDDEWPRFTKAIETLEDSCFYIDDTPAITPVQLYSRARALKARHGLDLILVDYLQLENGDGDKQGYRKDSNRTQEVSYVSRMLKFTARSLNVPVLSAAQLSRAVEQRADKRPVLSDLRESGSLEQDADIVMFIYRPDQYEKDTAKQNIAEIIVAKHRGGPVGSVELVFRNSLAKFENAVPKNMRMGNNGR